MTLLVNQSSDTLQPELNLLALLRPVISVASARQRRLGASRGPD